MKGQKYCQRVVLLSFLGVYFAISVTHGVVLGYCVNVPFVAVISVSLNCDKAMNVK